MAHRVALQPCAARFACTEVMVEMVMLVRVRVMARARTRGYVDP